MGAVQGVTEFLPVSSSGHLVLLKKIFGIEEPALLFGTMLHAGSLAAIIAVLRKDVWDIIRRPFQQLTGYLFIATVPIVIAGLLLRDYVEAAFDSGEYLGIAFLITAAFLFLSERLSKRTRKVKKEYSMNWVDALVIGIFQAIALTPGISRSGSTLSAALFRKLDREFAARFIFLLAIPAILGALVLELAHLFRGGINQQIDVIPYIVGTVTSAVVGIISVKLMLVIVRKRALWGFAIYVAVLGVLVLLEDQVRYVLSYFFNISF